jgi:hypothetical protein
MSGTVLSRLHSQDLSYGTPQDLVQAQVDTLVGRFVEEATDLRTLASLTAGGLAYRYGRMGTMALGNGQVAPSIFLRAGGMPLRLLSLGLGLGSEVVAFEFTQRSLTTLWATDRSPLRNPSQVTEHESPNLWSWKGQGGWKQALFNDVLTFGLLKGAGYLSRESNVVFQHAFSSTAMVTGHQSAALLGIAPSPEGSLANNSTQR